MLCCLTGWPALGWAAADAQVAGVVGQVIRPLMAANHIPGMAVGLVIDGRFQVLDFGLASVTPARPVTADTLFEIGSISKVFTATLAAHAAQQGQLSLAGMTSAAFPVLRGTAFDKISLIDLGTYTPGGMPLQLPDGIQNDAALIHYFRNWKPVYPPGTMRTYANPSIGLLGFITAAKLHTDFSTLVQGTMFPAFGLHHGFMDIPANQMPDLAEGYEDDGTPIRMTEDVLGPETYGVRITAADLLRFLAINMGMIPIDPVWQRAVTATHTGYDRVPAAGMVQDLVWEQLALPVGLAALQSANSDPIILDPQKVAAISPPAPPQAAVLLDKTGSTNGFGAYVAFIPADRTGVVLLANKDYPIPARVAAAYAILARLGAAGMAR